MASSKVMASTSPSNPDLPLQTDHTKNFGSMNMEDLLKNIYGDADAFPPPDSLSRQASKTVDEVWKEIVTGGAVSRDPEMTLEDFLTKAGAVQEDDVRIPPPVYPGGQFPVAMQSYCVEPVGFGSGRGKRRVVEEAPVDKATQQKQRRMIKNRESAARSRERKQAYTVELETLVTQLEEENARLLKQEAERTKKRFKELMENLIPVVEKRRPPRVLGRTNSM